MRTICYATLLFSPLVLVPVVTTSVQADSAILELRKTEVPSADAAPTIASPAPEDAAARPSRRHRVAGSHYERERLRQSQTHG